MRNVVLLASLAVNIFLIGLIAGGQLFGGGKPPPGDAKPSRIDQAITNPNDILPLRAIQTLPPEQRRVARKTIEEFLPKSRALQEEIARHRRRTIELVKQSTLDEQELAAAVDAMQTAQFEQQRLTGETIQKILTDLPDAERIALLVRVEEFRKMQREKRQQLRQQQLKQQDGQQGNMRDRVEEEVRRRMQEEQDHQQQEEEPDSSDSE